MTILRHVTEYVGERLSRNKFDDVKLINNTPTNQAIIRLAQANHLKCYISKPWSD